MTYNQKFKKQIESVVDRGLKKSPIPQKKGNSIAIGSALVSKTVLGYTVFDTKKHQTVAKTSHKMSALAIAKQYAIGRNTIDKVLGLDKTLEKLNTEIVFYENTMRKQQDTYARFAAETRYEMARQKIDYIKRTLDRYIYN